MRRGSLFWGLLFILAGTLFWLDNAGMLPAGLRAWDLLWPLALILAGLFMLIAQLLEVPSAPSPQEQTAIHVPLGEAQSVSLRVDHRIGELRMDAQASPGSALEGSCGCAAELNTRGERELEIDLRQPEFSRTAFGGAGTTAWALHFTPEVPVSLDLHWGMGEKRLDFSAAQLKRLALKGGMGEVHVKLPRPQHEVRVHIESGVGAVRVMVPGEAAFALQTERGLGQVHVRHPRAVSHGSGYETPDFAQANDRYVIEIKTGMGEIHFSAE